MCEISKAYLYFHCIFCWSHFTFLTQTTYWNNIMIITEIYTYLQLLWSFWNDCVICVLFILKLCILLRVPYIYDDQMMDFHPSLPTSFLPLLDDEVHRTVMKKKNKNNKLKYFSLNSRINVVNTFWHRVSVM